MLVWTLPPLAAAIAIGMGMDSRAGSRVVTPIAWVALVVWTLVAGLIWLPEREPEAPDARVREGIVIAAIFLGALPAAAYYALGRWLGERWKLLLLVALLSAIPFFFYLFFGVVA